MSREGDPLAVRLYRRALVVLPRGFRRLHGPAMVAMLADEWRDRRGAGRVRLMTRVLLDLLWTSMVERIRPGGAAVGETPARGRRGRGRIDIEPARARAGVSWLDARLGLRMLVKYPGLSTVGGFGIAVAVAIGVVAFEGISSVLDPALPVPGGERVVALKNATSNLGNPERRVLHDFFTWRDELTSVERLGAFRTVLRNVASGEGTADPVRGAVMTASGFDVVSTPPLLGRHLVPDDETEGAPHVVVLGHGVWRSRFGGDPDIVGRTVQLGGQAHTVVGVMAEGFRFPVNHDFWIPLRDDPSDYGRLEGPAIEIFGCLAPGVTLDQARAELATLGRRTAAEHPATHGRLRPTIVPYTHEHAQIADATIARSLRVVQVVVSLLLVVVCANVAILVYARTVTRRGEIAVRSALGASRRRILTHLFVEGLVLSGLATALGLVVAGAALHFVQAEVAQADLMPYWLDFRLSPGTALYAVALAVLAALLVGALPGLKATGRRLQVSLSELGKGAGMRLGRTWTALVVGQVAVGVALLPPTCLLAWGLVRPSLSEPGMPVDELVVASLGMAGEPFPGAGTEDERMAFAERFGLRQSELMARLASEPGVARVTFSSAVPGSGNARRIELEGGATLPPGSSAARARYLHVGPGFFEGYDGEVLTGRGLEAGDDHDGSTAVLVNREFVRQYMGDGPVLGRRLRYVPAVNVLSPGEPGTWFEVVGVVSDLPPGPYAPGTTTARVYHPVGPGDLQPVTLSIRTAGDPEPLVPRVRELVAEVHPDFQLHGVGVLASAIEEGRSLMMTLVGAMLLMASSVLLLSAAGMYALTSFTVAKRTREIGIRAALGAGSRRILGAVLSRVLVQLAAGVGVGAALAGAYFAKDGFTADRAGALMLTVLTFLAVGLVAALGPARRGLWIQPSEALRQE